jgi:hypothetical protein
VQVCTDSGLMQRVCSPARAKTDTARWDMCSCYHTASAAAMSSVSGLTCDYHCMERDRLHLQAREHDQGHKSGK